MQPRVLVLQLLPQLVLQSINNLSGTRAAPPARKNKKGKGMNPTDLQALLAALTSVIEPAEVTVSAAGLREGLLFQALPSAQRGVGPSPTVVQERYVAVTSTG